jgi:hypothetical protein
LLAFEDHWHFVALCALKCDGLLEDEHDPLLQRKIALKLGVQLRELDEIKRRLMEVGLIGDNFQPVKWEMRQHRKPDLPDGEELGDYRGYVYFIGDPASGTVKIGYSKNPWARVRDIQTGRTDRVAVVATVRTTDVSESAIHALFADERQSGEWFRVSERIQAVIDEVKVKRIADADELVNYVASYVATTKETEPDTETEELETNVSCASGDALKPEHVVAVWNDEIAPALGKPKVRKLTPERLVRLRARIAGFTVAEFREVIANIMASPFLRGDTGWHGFSFDWFTKKANFVKILEGNYNG